MKSRPELSSSALSREFEQWKLEWFCHPDEALKWYGFWREERTEVLWFCSLGVKKEN